VAKLTAAAAQQAFTPAPSAAPAVVILNPASNGGRAAKLRKVVEKALLGGRGELLLTTAPYDATHIAAEAARAGRPIVVVGGDGAVHEAASGLLSTGANVPFGVVPAGNGNDYAFHVAHMPHEPLAALELALTGPVERVDVGMVNDGYFVNALGVGLDANVTVTSERYKRYGLRGHPLYLASSISELLFRYDGCPTLSIQIDDGEPIRQTVALVAMNIGPMYGGGFHINPGAEPQDGLFDVCYIDKPPLLRALSLLHAIERGKHVGQREVHIVRCEHIVLESNTPVNAQLDGELSRATRFDVRILPGALALRRGPTLR
jgi:YegS/Rv2252/BmrU family lipid kinase